MGICSMEGCEKSQKYLRKGMCNSHYKRLLKYGDPNVSKKISNGEAQRFFNENVMPYEGDCCLIWPYGKFSSGYGNIHYGGKNVTVSKLVCEKAYGPKPTPEHQAAHSCNMGHMGCVAKRHLRWATPKENNLDKIDAGTLLHGEKAPWSVLDASQVADIYAMKGKLTQKEIGDIFGVSRTMIGLIHRKKRWVRELEN